jgi:preprotein translocase subunit SecE
MANVSVSKAKPAADDGFWHSMWQTGLYKPSQGRIARQATGWALFAIVVLFAWRAYYVFGTTQAVRYSLAAALVIVGGWFSYRIVNYPRFADFLIAVEAEMHKVSWPTWTELVRASLVVIITMFVLAMLLFGFDLVWGAIFQRIGILG